MDDLISRQEAINALETTKRIASYELHGGEVLRTFNVVLNSIINIMSLLPPANNSETPNSSDTISRAKAIDALRAMQTYKLFAGDDMLLIDQAGAQTELMMLPPAQPERIKGHWIEHDDGLTACECSVCHEKYNLYEEDVFGRNFCPNCGADMREVTE